MGLNTDPIELRIELAPESTDWPLLADTLTPADAPGTRVITNVDEYVEGFKNLFVRTRDGRLYAFKGADIVDLLKRWPGKKWRPVRLHRLGVDPGIGDAPSEIRRQNVPARRPR